MMKKRGFTLAEVLITLAIVGVVAALTMPNLIANYKKQTYVTQLRKTVSTLEQGFQKMRADAGGVDSLEDTEIFINIRNSDDPEPQVLQMDRSMIANSFYRNDMAKYFNILDFPKTPSNYRFKYRNSDDYEYMGNERRILLSDGVTLDIFMIQFDENTVGVIWLDVNGFKSPNTYGYDIFQLAITPTGQLIDKGIADNCKDGSDEIGCYNYLVRNGWKMDY